jgi:hypothetical protein
MFLVEKTGSSLGYWEGELTAGNQKALFGKVLGRGGRLHIDGERETVMRTVHNERITHKLAWRDL